MSDATGASGAIIEAVKVHKTFTHLKQPLCVLRDADLRVMPGEMLGIVGASGAGKSTLLHILGGLDRPTRGDVLFRGKGIFTQKNGFLEKFRNTSVGFVFQFFNLLPEFTVLENALMPALINGRGKKAAREDAERLLTQVGLKERLEHKPGELSGGESQRVALARALINKPELVLADEPTGNLDANSSGALLDLICRLNEELRQTFVIVTHSQRVATRMHRVLQLADGGVHPLNTPLVL